MRAAKELRNKDVAMEAANNILTNDYDEDMLFQLVTLHARAVLNSGSSMNNRTDTNTHICSHKKDYRMLVQVKLKQFSGLDDANV